MRTHPTFRRTKLPMRAVTRISALALAAACARPAPPPESAPPPVPATSEPRPRPEAERRLTDIRICVADLAGLRELAARYDPATGDTLLDGRRISARELTTPNYAESQMWYINNEPIERPSIPRLFTKYGLPRVVEISELRLAGEHGGVNLYREVADTIDGPTVVYAPVRPGCEFQPYQWDLIGPGIRGE
jgi:hypothetical protein